MSNTAMKFETGKTYMARSVCNHDCIIMATIVKRTEKTVTADVDGNTRRFKVQEWGGIEHFLPWGRYSMSPLMSADSPIEHQAVG